MSLLEAAGAVQIAGRPADDGTAGAVEQRFDTDGCDTLGREALGQANWSGPGRRAPNGLPVVFGLTFWCATAGSPVAAMAPTVTLAPSRVRRLMLM
ncbi:MAG: hypothetical protein IT193_12210 [Propionibacteriaceae bacterium]|nr:hypothetical protein [Propionibacteriaceae bacterium]